MEPSSNHLLLLLLLSHFSQSCPTSNHLPYANSCKLSSTSDIFVTQSSSHSLQPLYQPPHLVIHQFLAIFYCWYPLICFLFQQLLLISYYRSSELFQKLLCSVCVSGCILFHPFLACNLSNKRSDHVIFLFKHFHWLLIYKMISFFFSWLYEAIKHLLKSIVLVLSSTTPSRLQLHSQQSVFVITQILCTCFSLWHEHSFLFLHLAILT